MGNYVVLVFAKDDEETASNLLCTRHWDEIKEREPDTLEDLVDVVETDNVPPGMGYCADCRNEEVSNA